MEYQLRTRFVYLIILSHLCRLTGEFERVLSHHVITLIGLVKLSFSEPHQASGEKAHRTMRNLQAQLAMMVRA